MALRIITILLVGAIAMSLSAAAPIRIRGDDGGVVYLAVVIHMNQLLENISDIDVYGRNAYSVFYEESVIPLQVNGVKLVIDITGPTIHSLAETAPGIIENIREGVRRGRVEILGITYGQVPAQFLPMVDVRRHVYYENLLIEKYFNTTPRGFWQEDRQWTPNLTKVVSMLGYEYTLIDDNVFWRANPGLDPVEEYYPHRAVYREGNETYSVAVFNIDKFLRYHLRGENSIDDIKKYLRQVLDEARGRGFPPIVVYGDDAEFGLNRRVLEELAREPWIRFVTLSEYLDMYGDRIGVASFNVTGAYEEYEGFFGSEWWRWYGGGEAREILGVFSAARGRILLLEERADDYGLAWLLDAAWTSLLLAEWQYGHFYKNRGDVIGGFYSSNAQYALDAYLLAQAGLEYPVNGTVYRRYSVFGREYYALANNTTYIAVDKYTGTIRVIVDYVYRRIISPLPVFSGRWWGFTVPGAVYVGPIDSVEHVDGELLLHASCGDIHVSLGDSTVTLYAGSRQCHFTLRLSPGGFFNYLYNTTPRILYRISNDTTTILDTNGHTITIKPSTTPPYRIPWGITTQTITKNLTITMNKTSNPDTTNYKPATPPPKNTQTKQTTPLWIIPPLTAITILAITTYITIKRKHK